MADRPYIYAEDSRLLGEVISSLDDSDSFLEIGAGNGGNLIPALKKFRLVVGTDINPNLRGNFSSDAESILADRTSCFRPSSFDVVAFNPPYVPSEAIYDRATDGGKDGLEIPKQFLVSALEVLKPNGKVLMLISSESKIEDLEDFFERNNLNVTKVAETKLFFESLFVYLIKPQIKF